MKNKPIIVCLLLGLVYAAHGQNQQQQPFTKSTMLRSELTPGQEKNAKIPVQVDNYIISGGQNVKINFPVPGLLWIIHVKAGKLSASINEKKQEYGTGDFFIVRPNSDFLIQTEDDAVILQLYGMGESYMKARKTMTEGLKHTQREERYRPLVENAFMKESVVIGDVRNPVAKVVDINVGPGLKTGSIRFDGPSILQVTTGEVMLTIQDKQVQGKMGFMSALESGNSFVVNNNDKKRPATLRIIVYQP